MGPASDGESDLPSAKVSPKDRDGVEGWLHFHAAYSRRFARNVLETLDPESRFVLDPFCGVGTTARAAAQVGYRSLSLDLNPAVIALARATLTPAEGATSVIRTLRRVDGPNGSKPLSRSGIETEWLDVNTQRQLDYFRRRFRDTRRGKAGRDFGMGLLVSAAKEVLSPDYGSNPTWPKPPEEPPSTDVARLLHKRALSMRRSLRKFSETVECPEQHFAVGDAKNLPLEDGSVDVILTSPPYLSRIDYVKATLPQLLMLGYSNASEIGELRRRIMGGVLTGRSADGDWPGWGDLTNDVLKKIESHDSKASDTYYSTLARRYFADLDETVGETLRVLRPQGVSLFVVQTSYYKDVPIPLDKILVELARSRGGRGMILQEEEVRQHFGHLSPHQREYAGKKVLRESVVRLQC